MSEGRAEPEAEAEAEAQAPQVRFWDAEGSAPASHPLRDRGAAGQSPRTGTKGDAGCHPEVTSGWARAGEAGWAEDGGAAAAASVVGTRVSGVLCGSGFLVPSHSFFCGACLVPGCHTVQGTLRPLRLAYLLMKVVWRPHHLWVGGCVNPQARELMTLLCFRRPKGCVSCEMRRSEIV